MNVEFMLNSKLLWMYEVIEAITEARFCDQISVRIPEMMSFSPISAEKSHSLRIFFKPGLSNSVL